MNIRKFYLVVIVAHIFSVVCMENTDDSYKLIYPLVKSMEAIFQRVTTISLTHDNQVKKDNLVQVEKDCFTLQNALLNLKKAVVSHGFNPEIIENSEKPLQEGIFFSNQWLNQFGYCEVAEKMVQLIDHCIIQLNTIGSLDLIRLHTTYTVNQIANHTIKKYTREVLQLLKKLDFFFVILSNPTRHWDDIRYEFETSQDDPYIEHLATLWNVLYYRHENSIKNSRGEKQILKAISPWIEKANVVSEGIDEAANQSDLAGVLSLFLNPGIKKPILKFIEDHAWVRWVARKFMPAKIGQIEKAQKNGKPLTSIMGDLKRTVSPQTKPMLLGFLSNYGAVIFNPTIWLINKCLEPAKRTVTNLKLSAAKQNTTERTVEESFKTFFTQLAQRYKRNIPYYCIYSGLFKLSDTPNKKQESEFDQHSIMSLSKLKDEYTRLQKNLLLEDTNIDSKIDYEAIANYGAIKLEIKDLKQKLKSCIGFDDRILEGRGYNIELKEKKRAIMPFREHCKLFNRRLEIKEELEVVKRKLKIIELKLLEGKKELEDGDNDLKAYLESSEMIKQYEILFSETSPKRLSSKGRRLNNDEASSSKDPYPVKKNNDEFIAPASLSQLLHDYQSTYHKTTPQLFYGWVYYKMREQNGSYIQKEENNNKEHRRLNEALHNLAEQRNNKLGLLKQKPWYLLVAISPLYYLSNSIYTFFKRKYINYSFNKQGQQLLQQITTIENNNNVLNENIGYMTYKELCGHPEIAAFEVKPENRFQLHIINNLMANQAASTPLWKSSISFL